jgi:hypothetical protein
MTAARQRRGWTPRTGFRLRAFGRAAEQSTVDVPVAVPARSNLPTTSQHAPVQGQEKPLGNSANFRGDLTRAEDYETGGLRRAHVRGHENVLKRLLVHASAFNLGLWMRRLFGVGTPRALQGRAVALGALLSALWPRIDEAIVWIWPRDASPTPARRTSTGLITWA